MRYIISQISALWEMSLTPNPPTESVDPAIPVEALAHTWRPWEANFVFDVERYLVYTGYSNKDYLH
jgi:hypothetical protein